jgi:predicted small metal-binding protein
MRAFDCSHEAHEDMHFTASSDDELLDQIKRHRDEYHTEISDDQITELVTQGAYDE